MIQASSNSARLVAEDRVRMTGAVTTRGGTAAGGQHRVFIELRACDCCPTQRGVDTVDTDWALPHTGHTNIAVTLASTPEQRGLLSHLHPTATS